MLLRFRERLNDEELEQKFTSLALAFAIDAATIKDRCERQRRSRDQTETNLTTEIERLREKLALLQPLCTDYETVQLLSTLLSQVGCNCLCPNLNLVSRNMQTISPLKYHSEKNVIGNKIYHSVCHQRCSLDYFTGFPIIHQNP